MSVSVGEQTCMCTQAVAKSDCILVSFKVSTDVVYLNGQWMMISCKHIILSFSWRFPQYPPVCSLFSSSVPSQSPLIYCLRWHGEKSEQFSVWRLSSECWWKQCLWPSHPLILVATQCCWCPLQIMQHWLLWHTTVCIYILWSLHNATMH